MAIDSREVNRCPSQYRDPVFLFQRLDDPGSDTVTPARRLQAGLNEEDFFAFHHKIPTLADRGVSCLPQDMRSRSEYRERVFPHAQSLHVLPYLVQYAASHDPHDTPMFFASSRGIYPCLGPCVAGLA